VGYNASQSEVWETSALNKAIEKGTDAKPRVKLSK